MPSYIIWIPLTFFAVSLISIPIAGLVFRRMKEVEQDEESYEGATEDWSPIDEMMATARMGETGELDLTWFQLHIRMVEIEERIVDQAKTVIDKTIALLLDDSKWSVASVETANIPSATVATVNTVPMRVLVIPGKTTSVDTELPIRPRYYPSNRRVAQ